MVRDGGWPETVTQGGSDMREIRRICRPEGIGDVTLKRKTVAGVFEPIQKMQLDLCGILSSTHSVPPIVGGGHDGCET